jgi:coenzyme F420-0:L-glutamate ligase / coenzyme F420-1:gamma-L-glutamate ligase
MRIEPKTKQAASVVQIVGLAGLPEISPGADLAGVILAATKRRSRAFQDGDLLVVAQKIVSKAEGRLVPLSAVKPSAAARRIAKKMRKDPRFIEVVLRESRRVVRSSERVLIVETRQGFVCANAGVDRSNAGASDCVTCLPRDPDGSARRLAAALRKRTGKRVAVIISDTFGRPWRLGLTNVALGAAGLGVLRDLRGDKDASGRRLSATVLAVADELAAAAGLVMGKTERVPVAIVRGYQCALAKQGAKGARDLIRPAAQDLFR